MTGRLIKVVQVYRAIAEDIQWNIECDVGIRQYLLGRMKTLNEAADDIEEAIGICVE